VRIVIVTDAWTPQVNGVVTTLTATRACLEARGHQVLMVTPQDFLTVPCPTYPSIRLAVMPSWSISRMLEDFRPQAIHIATEGPLGHAARHWCVRRGLPFTTSFHTQFPEYIRARFPFPRRWTYAILRRFHGSAVRTMVATPSQRDRLIEQGFNNLVLWSRGVDVSLFRPGEKSFIEGQRPVAMYMGRVAVEKNIEAFLALDLPGSKVVVGDGPDLERLRAAWPGVRFTGQKRGDELARWVAAADVFVFPSLTDTFGLVLLEAMACGVPVAAYPVTGPIDVVEHGVTGALDEDLGRAVRLALTLDPAACIAAAASRSWEACTAAFEGHLAPFEYPATRAASA
jgi:glycosyltransferase involved in cell wall biosynthesis